MAKSRRKKARKSAELENRLKQVSFTLAAVLLGQLVESLVKRSSERATEPDEPGTRPPKNLEPATKPLLEGVEALKSVADDLIPRWSEIFAAFKHKIEGAVERLADVPGEFDRPATLGPIDGFGEILDASFPETEPKKSKKKKKKPK